MSYDSWKTTEPAELQDALSPDYDVREELDDYDRADLSDEEIAYIEERQAERDTLGEIAFWKAVNDLAIEFPEFTVTVSPAPEVDNDCPF